MDILTTGRVNNAGYQIPALCFLEGGDLNLKSTDQVYTMIHIKKGFGQLRINHENIMVNAPAICCFNEKELPELISGEGLSYESIFFKPSVINMNLTYEVIANYENNNDEDIWFYTPYFIRTDNFAGILKMNTQVSKFISEKFLCIHRELTEQQDFFWPCRSRSYFLELFLLIKRIEQAKRESDRVMISNCDCEVQAIIEYLQINYKNKITVNDITKEFSTNKTTLSKRFKDSTGVSPIEFLTSLRIQIACAMLRDTYIPITEIMCNTGFIDDAHFTRIFYKHMHCTPAAYRKQHNWIY